MFSLSVQHNIQKIVRTLWQQLVAQRRQELEDTCKIDLSVKPGESEVKIEEITPLWEETMLKAWQHYLGLCPIGSRDQNCWVSQMQTSPSSTQDPEPFSTTSSRSSLWWVGWKSLRPPETLLTKNECCFASWVKERPEMQAASSNLLEKVYALSEL